MTVKNNKEVLYKTKKKATIWSNKPIAEHIYGEKHGLEQLGCSHILAVAVLQRTSECIYPFRQLTEKLIKMWYIYNAILLSH